MFEMKTIGKPCAGKPHARFDEEVQNCLKESGSGFTLLFFGTPRGVYISVGEIPTRQLTIRAVANEIVYFERVRKL